MQSQLFLYLNLSGRSLFLKKKWYLFVGPLKGLYSCGTRFTHTAKHQVLFHRKFMYEFYRTCASESAPFVRPSVAKRFHTLALHLDNEVWEPSHHACLSSTASFACVFYLPKHLSFCNICIYCCEASALYPRKSLTHSLSHS